MGVGVREPEIVCNTAHAKQHSRAPIKILKHQNALRQHHFPQNPKEPNEQRGLKTLSKGVQIGRVFGCAVMASQVNKWSISRSAKADPHFPLPLTAVPSSHSLLTSGRKRLEKYHGEIFLSHISVPTVSFQHVTFNVANIILLLLPSPSPFLQEFKDLPERCNAQEISQAADAIYLKLSPAE